MIIQRSFLQHLQTLMNAKKRVFVIRNASTCRALTAVNAILVTNSPAASWKQWATVRWHTNAVLLARIPCCCWQTVQPYGNMVNRIFFFEKKNFFDSDMITNNYHPLISQLESAVALDYWHENKTLVWSDVSKEQVMAFLLFCFIFLLFSRT